MPTDIQNEVSFAVQRDLGRLEGKMDALLMQLTEHIKKDEEAWRKVGSLEKKLVYFSGVFAALGFFVTAVLKKVGIL